MPERFKSVKGKPEILILLVVLVVLTGVHLSFSGSTKGQRVDKAMTVRDFHGCFGDDFEQLDPTEYVKWRKLNATSGDPSVLTARFIRSHFRWHSTWQRPKPVVYCAPHFGVDWNAAGVKDDAIGEEELKLVEAIEVYCVKHDIDFFIDSDWSGIASPDELTYHLKVQSTRSQQHAVFANSALGGKP